MNTLLGSSTPQLPVYSPSDLTSTLPTGAVSPTRRQDAAHQKRKQTLLALLDAINELTNEGPDHDAHGAAPVDYGPEGPSADDQLQSKGVEAFNRFQRRVQQLDKELQNFANAVRQLGSSVRILSSSFHLRQRLLQVLFLVRENAAVLFPRKISRQRRELSLHDEIKKRMQKDQAGRRRVKVPATRPIVQDDLTLESFPEELEHLANDVTTFLECLNEFPEFTDETVNESILAFEGDLKYWASCLKEFKTRLLTSSAVKRYIHDLSGEMGDRIDNITSAISVFVEVGVPTIRFAQKHAATNLLNLSTVATFFSAVTATTIQFSFEKVQGPLQNAVNAFWFSSLVFSIASAVNSLLGLTWKQTIYRSPRHRVSWLVLIWIKRSPLIFLVVSVAAFSIGLVLFTWSSGQHLATCIVTTVFTGFSSFGLLAVSTWFALERITYSRHKGKRWLADILADLTADVRRYTGVKWAGEVLPRHTKVARSWSATQVGRFMQAGGAFIQAASRTLIALREGKNEKEGKNEECATVPPPDIPVSPLAPSTHGRLSDATSVRFEPSTPKMPMPSEPSAPSAETAGDTNNLTAPRQSTQRGTFADVVRAVMQSTSNPDRKSTGFSDVVGALDNPIRGRARRRDSSEPITAARLRRLIMVNRVLKDMDVSMILSTHQGMVRDLQFSPNGKWLATCSWDRTSVLYKVSSGNPDSFMPHRTLAHLEGFVHQVAWSPKGGLLLTRLNRSVKVWAENGVCVKTIERHTHVQSVAWLPHGKEFLSVEGSEVNRMDLTGKVMDRYRLPRLALHDVAVTPDEKRIIGVATLIESPDGLQPLKARIGKRIFVYKLAEKEIESQAPVLHNVRDITIASDGCFALVSYDDKYPPQLWWLHRATDNTSNMRLSLRHTYMPNTDVAFAGPSYFGGKDDQFILCAGQNGHIHIWDRESATLLHDLHVPDGDLTGIAWNTASDTPMFATGSHGGTVKIWSSSLRQPNINDSRSQSLVRSRAESPTPLGSILVETPTPIGRSILVDTPTPMGSILVETPTPMGSMLVETPPLTERPEVPPIGLVLHRQPSPGTSQRESPGLDPSTGASSIGPLPPEASREECVEREIDLQA